MAPHAGGSRGGSGDRGVGVQDYAGSSRRTVPDAIDAAVERGHDAHTGALGTRHEVGVGEAEASDLIQFDRAQKESNVDDPH